MPLTIVLTAVLGWWAVGLAPATALLLGAVLAPTDPVLAADVQVGPPGGDPAEEDDLRFSLTSEAGLNDALAFPFTNAAIALALAGTGASTWVLDWLAVDVVYKLAVGCSAACWSASSWPSSSSARRSTCASPSRGEGFVALAGTFLAYGLTEVAGGYGFLAVFVAAVALRRSEHDHDYHSTLHDFAEQTEQLLMIALVVLLGGAVAGGVLAPLTWQAAAVALVVLFVVRPAHGVGRVWPAPRRPSPSGRPSPSSASAASARSTTSPTRSSTRASPTPSSCGPWSPSPSSCRCWSTARRRRWSPGGSTRADSRCSRSRDRLPERRYVAGGQKISSGSPSGSLNDNPDP